MKEDNAYYCRQAIELGLVRNSTEFWTKVKTSGLTPREWVRIASSGQPQEERYPELDGTPFSDKAFHEALEARKWDNLQSPGYQREDARTKVNYGTVRISTSHISHRPSSDEIVIDVTVKSGLPIFAPTWKMVRGYLDGRISEKQYTLDYLRMMEVSFGQNRPEWESLLHRAALEGKVIVLCCYCRAGNFCHRHLLAKILREKAEGLSYHGLILPER